MRNRTKRAPAVLGAPIITLATLFLAGGAVGSYFAANMPLSSRGYVLEYIAGAGSGGAWRVPALELALLLAVFLSAFLRAGAIVPLAAMAAKGFLLSMLITSFVGTLGAAGFLAALPALLLAGFVPVACLVLVSLQALGISAERRRAPGGRIYVDKSFYLAAGLCALATAASSALYIYLTPLAAGAAAIL